MHHFRTTLRAAVALLALVALLPVVSWAAARKDDGQQRLAAAEQRIEAGDAAELAFGEALALSGDLLAVGAPEATVDNVEGAGAVYLYRRDPQAAAGWTRTHTVHHDPPIASMKFGAALALDGDTLVVGAPRYDAGGYSRGGAYVFERDQGGADAWGLVRQLEDEPVDESDKNLRLFGWAVAVRGDLIAVSARKLYNEQGQVFLYHRTGGWARAEELANPETETMDYFGSAIAIDGDTLAIGAAWADLDAATADTGAVFLYKRDPATGQWVYDRRLAAGAPQNSAAFGSALALAGDTLVVGSYNENRMEGGQQTANQTGAGYVFERDRGGPGQWGLAAALRPDDAVTLDMVGESVATDGERVWLGSPNRARGSLNRAGRLYHYERDPGGGWAAPAVIEASDGGYEDQFGRSLAVDGDTLLAGAPWREPGAVYLATAAAPTTAGAFLPALMGGAYASTGLLHDGESLQDASGAIIGALPGTLSGPVDATIAPTGAPSQSLPAGFLPRGDYYLLGTRSLLVAPHDKPLLVGLPVPQSADLNRLAAAVLVPDKTLTEQEEPDAATRSWTIAPGRYDAANNLFVLTVGALLPEGVTLVLFEHPDNEPLTQMARAAAQTAEYYVRCDPARDHTNICNTANRRMVEDELEAAHAEYVDKFGFREPRMVRIAGRFVGDELVPAADAVAFQGAIIAESPCAGSSGQPITGEYSYATMQLLVCFDLTTPSDDIRRTVRHELFHAVQASYTQLAIDNTQAPKAQTGWLVEGTATAAEESSDYMYRSPLAPLRWATHSLLDVEEAREYQAQDLWVYAGLQGLQGDNSLGYLRPILAAGATPQRVAGAMDLAEAYWKWAKNQVFEHHQSMDGAFAVGPCEFDPATFDGQGVKLLDYPDEFTVEGTLPPLTTAIVQIRTTISRQGMPVWVETGGDEADLIYKVVQIGEAGCENIPDGRRNLVDLSAGELHYVLISNVSFTDDMDYVVFVD